MRLVSLRTSIPCGYKAMGGRRKTMAELEFVGGKGGYDIV